MNLIFVIKFLRKKLIWKWENKKFCSINFEDIKGIKCSKIEKCVFFFMVVIFY